MNEERRARYHTGKFAEKMCQLVLLLRGYSILAARLRTPAGEIDIVAARGGIVAVIEVKARRTTTEALAAVSMQQRIRLARAAQHFLAGKREHTGKTVRFDVMAVAPWAWPVHVQDAWRP
ncbi:MAG: YraN family protein [Alphaproteobacteria bacterium]|nr:YraN family protein [Alphaproteobacteria bacterium]